MKNKEITETHFNDYLISLGLFKIAITDTFASSFTAQLVGFPKPNINDFSQILKTPSKDYPYYEVRLSKEDLFNEHITKGFFD